MNFVTKILDLFQTFTEWKSSVKRKARVSAIHWILLKKNFLFQLKEKVSVTAIPFVTEIGLITMPNVSNGNVLETVIPILDNKNEISEENNVE